MFGGGRGFGGGGLRTFGRAVTRAGVNLPEPISSSNSSSTTSPTSSPAHSRRSRKSGSNFVSLPASESSFCSYNLPVPVNSGVVDWGAFGSGSGSAASFCDEFDWVSVDGNGGDDIRFGHAPSVDEVHEAVSSLQQVLNVAIPSEMVKEDYYSDLNNDVVDQFSSSTAMIRRVSSFGSEVEDWMEPSMSPFNSRMFQPHVYNQVNEAFHLLQTEPSVQRMVISLSSDRAVWDAVINNEVVRELWEAYHEGLNEVDISSEIADETSADSNPAAKFMKLVFSNTRMKIIKVLEKITKLVSDIIKVPNEAKRVAEEPAASDPFGEKLQVSFLLSIIVLLVVVVGRANRA